MNEVEIQCPVCGGQIVSDEKGIKKLYRCLKCKMFFPEWEIRERCGI